MVYLTLILAVIALVIAILAYQKAGGLADLKKQIEQITSSDEIKRSMETLASATDSIKEKTAEAIGKIEATFKKETKEEKTPTRRPAARKTTRRKRPTRPRKAERPSAEETAPEKTEASS
jgi:hypothetical protein